MRLGRDFVEVGQYTDVVFPSLGCRFISVVDCLDSAGDNTDMLHFRSLMNDYHLKDLSKKIKSVLYAKMRDGQYISAFAPYGYRKSENDRHRLVIDEESAAVAGKNEQERQKKAGQLSALETEVRRYEQDNANIRQWTTLVRKYLNVQELDRPIVDELVERIEVRESSMIDGQRQQDVRIYYRFVGLVE